MPIVKLGNSRQVVIPKKLQDELGLEPGDFLEVVIEGDHLVFTPKALVDKALERHLAESAADIKAGRTYGPFKTAKKAVSSMKRHLRKRAAGRRSVAR